MTDRVLKALGLVSVLVVALLLPLSYCISRGVSASEPRFYDNVESGQDGWNATGLWHITTRHSYSPSHSWWFGDESSGTYDVKDENGNSIRTYGNLTSPPISLIGMSHAYLIFYYYLDLETTYDPAGWEFAYVLISKDGGATWDKIGRLSHTNGLWEVAVFDISNYVGYIINVRFYFDSRDGVDNNHEGWFIDDVKITEGEKNIVILTQKRVEIKEINDNPTRSGSRVIQLNYTGTIEFISDEKIRGASLGGSSEEYVVTPGTQLTIRVMLHNTYPVESLACDLHLKIYNRFGVEVHSAVQKDITILSGHSVYKEFKWTPMLSDQYIVVIFVKMPGEPISVDPWNLVPNLRLQWRSLKVYDYVLNDDVENGTDGWQTESHTVRPDNGDWQIETSKWYSWEHSWHGGDYYYVGGGGQYLISPILNITKYWWVHKYEAGAVTSYPSPVEVGEDGRIKLFLTFYYLYYMNRGDVGYLDIRTKYGDQDWSDWHVIWDTSDYYNAHQWQPENRIVWSDDYTRELPIYIDLSGYLPDSYQNTWIQIRFRVTTSLSGMLGASYGWWLDNIALGGIVESYNFSMEISGQDTINVDPSAGKQEVRFQFWVRNAPSNIENTVELEVSGVPYGTENDRWNYYLTDSYFSLFGNESSLIGLVITTNNTPSPGIYEINVSGHIVPRSGLEEGEKHDWVIFYLIVSATDIMLEVDEKEKNVTPGSTVTYTITITNTGADERDITLSYSPTPLPSGWSVDIHPKNLTVIPGYDNAERTYVQVQAPDHALPSTVLDLTVFATYVNSTGDNITTSVNLRVVVAEYRDVKLYCDNPDEHTLGGGNASYALRIYNKGNVNDTYSMMVNVPSGFEYSLNPSPPYNVVPYSSTMVTLSVNVPEKTSGLYTIYATAVSVHDPSVQSSVSMNLTVGSLYDIHVVPETRQISADAGSFILFNVTIWNNGTMKDSMRITFGGDLASYASSTPSETDPMNRTENNPQKIRVSISLPKDYVAGEHSLVIYAYAYSNPSYMGYADVAINILPYYKIDISPSKDRFTLDSGSNGTFTITVYNNGNAEDDVTLNYESEDACITVEFEEETVTLKPFSSAQINATLYVASDAKSGSYTVSITGRSSHGANDSASVSVDVNTMYGVLLHAPMPSVNVNPLEETSTSWSVYVKNIGNTKDTYTVIAEASSSKISVTPSSTAPSTVTVEAYDEVEITVTATFSSTIPPSTYTISLSARSTSSPSTSSTIQLNLTITSVHEISVSVDKTAKDVDVGESTTFVLSVENSGNVDEQINVTVKGDKAEWAEYPKSIVISPGSKRELPITINAPKNAKTGTYTLTVILTTKDGRTYTQEIKFTVKGYPEIIFGLNAVELGIIGAVILLVIAGVAHSRARKKAKPALKARTARREEKKVEGMQLKL
ncbi:MAG: hypothetical protein DRN20_01535 [Thermoplasmata archaeon]|nr:MAG: hypothetical protein DRN20_01535 [Thermoplasmata archaeon]